MAPVGLLGKGKINTFVFGVMAARSSSAVNLKLFSALVTIGIGVAPA